MGVVRIKDKLIEHPEFTGTISLIHHAAFVAGEEFGRSNSRSEISSGSHNLSASDSRSGPALSVNEALLAFVSMDHVSLLGLGDLDMQGIRELCAFDSAGETPEGMLINGDGGEGAGGNIGVSVGNIGGDNDKDMGGGANIDAGDPGLGDGVGDVDLVIS